MPENTTPGDTTIKVLNIMRALEAAEPEKIFQPAKPSPLTAEMLRRILNIDFTPRPPAETSQEGAFRNLPPQVQEEVLSQAQAQLGQQPATASVGGYTSSWEGGMISPQGTWEKRREISDLARDLLRVTKTEKDLGPGTAAYERAISEADRLKEAMALLDQLAGPKPEPPKSEPFPWEHLLGAGIALLGGALLGAPMGVPGIITGLGGSTGYLTGAYSSYLQKEAAKQAAYQAELDYAAKQASTKGYMLQTLYPFLSLQPKMTAELGRELMRGATSTTATQEKMYQHGERIGVSDRPAQEAYQRGLIGLGHAKIRAQTESDWRNIYATSIYSIANIADYVANYGYNEGLPIDQLLGLKATAAEKSNLGDVVSSYLMTKPGVHGFLIIPEGITDKMGLKPIGWGKEKSVKSLMLSPETAEQLRKMKLSGDLGKDLKALKTSGNPQLRDLADVISAVEENGGNGASALMKLHTQIQEYDPESMPTPSEEQKKRDLEAAMKSMESLQQYLEEK